MNVDLRLKQTWVQILTAFLTSHMTLVTFISLDFTTLPSKLEPAAFFFRATMRTQEM